MSNFEPRELQCADCGKTFEFSVEDQEFYASKGFSEPKRCPECRNAKKIRNSQRKRERVMYPAVCSACGCETTVPFRPIEGRPVFCPNCYKQQNS